jgi:nucleotide-binding universal stress UspA family protein
MKQKRKSSILVAIDESEYSEKAFEYACKLSIGKEMPLLIANIVEEHATIGYSILKELKNSSNELLDKYETRAKSLGVQSVDSIQSVGNPAEEILKIANRKKIDTLVIGSRGRYGTSRDLLGGTSYKLVHYSNCTVTIVK